MSDPLTDKHCDCLNEALRLLAEAKQIIDKCKRSGLDMGDLEREHEFKQTVASGLKAEFFPNRS